MPELSVVIPATDAPATLGRCLAAIDRAHDRPDQVVVVDGPAELSASEARNAGVAEASGEVVVFVDADVEIHPDAFVRLRAAFDDDPQLTAIHGSYDDAPDNPSTVSAFRNLLHHHVHQRGGGEAETFWTGLGAVRRAEFLAVGGFDAHRYPHPSIEDIELGDRLRAAGGTLRLDPRIQGTHLKRWTLRSMLWTDFARRGVPWVALQVRTRRLASTLNMGWRHRVSALLVVALLALLIVGPRWIVLPLAGGLLVTNAGLYRLLVGRLGVVRGMGAVGLHWLHHLVAIASVPAGVASALVAAVVRRDLPPASTTAAAPADVVAS